MTTFLTIACVVLLIIAAYLLDELNLARNEIRRLRSHMSQATIEPPPVMYNCRCDDRTAHLVPKKAKASLGESIANDRYGVGLSEGAAFNDHMDGDIDADEVDRG